MGQLEHAQELSEEGSQSAATTAFHDPDPFPSNRQSALTVTHYLKHHKAVRRVRRTNQSADINGTFIVTL